MKLGLMLLCHVCACIACYSLMFARARSFFLFHYYDVRWLIIAKSCVPLCMAGESLSHSLDSSNLLCHFILVSPKMHACNWCPVADVQAGVMSLTCDRCSGE